MPDAESHLIEEAKKVLMSYMEQIHKSSTEHCNLDVSQFNISFNISPPKKQGDEIHSELNIVANFGDMNKDLMECLKFGIENTPEPMQGLKQIILNLWKQRYDSLIR